MLNLIKNLLSINSVFFAKAKAVTTYDEALSFYVAKNYKAAAPLMTQAAELGSLDAMTILGSMYLLGHGVKEDGAAAVYWLEKAVGSGYEGAVSVLGMAYATGKSGVKVNLPKAREMLSFAAQKGDEKSARMLQMIDNGEGIFAKLKTRSPGRR